MCLRKPTKRGRRDVGRAPSRTMACSDALQRPLRSRFQPQLTPGVRLSEASIITQRKLRCGAALSD
jgi:hypothetical protein